MIIKHQIILEIENSISCFNKCCALCIVKCCLSSEGILQHASQLHLRYSTICLRNHKDIFFADVEFTWISFFPLFSWFFVPFRVAIWKYIHMGSSLKLNLNMGLFSYTFLFEAVFRFFGILVLVTLPSYIGPKSARKWISSINKLKSDWKWNQRSWVSIL